MTYPIDDAGNPRVDFVWGPFPIQPDDQRIMPSGPVYVTNQPENTNWTEKLPVYSNTLATGLTTLSFPTGDGGAFREQTFAYDNHKVATTQYEGYPGFIQGAPYDDTIPNVTVPNVVDFDSVAAATAYLQDAGLTVGVVTTSTVGATSENNNWVKSQSPAAGTLVNAGSTVTLVEYDYVAPANTILAMRYNMSMQNQGNVDMIIPGQIVKPAVYDIVNVSGNSRSDFNGTAIVYAVANDNGYTTGSTKVRLSSPVGGDMDWHTGGTWTAVPHTFPLSVPLPYSSMGQNWSFADNSGVGGRIVLTISDNSPAYKYFVYSGVSADNDGYVGKTMTLSNMESAAGAMGTAPYPTLNGTKAIYASDMTSGMMGGFVIKITLDDTTDVTESGMGRTISGSVVVNA